MATVTDRIAVYRHTDGTEAWCDLTFDVPSPLVWDPDENTFSNDDEDQCDLISMQAHNGTPIPITVWVARRSGARSIERTLSPGQTVTDSAPFPGGMKDLADLLAWSWEV